MTHHIRTEAPDDESRDNEYYTEIEHHQDWLDPRDTGDISRPQGWFWYQNERPGADEFMDIEIGHDSKTPPAAEAASSRS